MWFKKKYDHFFVTHEVWDDGIMERKGSTMIRRHKKECLLKFHDHLPDQIYKAYGIKKGIVIITSITKM